MVLYCELIDEYCYEQVRELRGNAYDLNEPVEHFFDIHIARIYTHKIHGMGIIVNYFNKYFV